MSIPTHGHEYARGYTPALAMDLPVSIPMGIPMAIPVGIPIGITMGIPMGIPVACSEIPSHVLKNPSRVLTPVACQVVFHPC